MYHKYPSGEIALWCDGCTNEDSTGCKKRKRDDSSSGHSKRQKREEEVDTVFDQLKEKHGSKYNTPHLRLWARMIANSLHDDFEEPPNIPAFSSVSKRPRQQSVTSAISGAAITLAKALGGTPKEDAKDTSSIPTTTPTSSYRQTGLSPGKAVELRMKNYEQLRYLQQLFEDGILSDSEYAEQKQDILGSLRKL